MTTFVIKSEKFELFEDLFRTSLKIFNQLTEEDKINYFHNLMQGDALQNFKIVTSPNRENLGEILTMFRRNYLKPQSMVTAKLKFQRLVFSPASQTSIDFLDELQKLAKDAFGVAAYAIIQQFIYAQMPPHLKKSINQALFENGTYEQIVSHFEKALELSGLEDPDEVQMNTVTQQVTQQDSKKPKPTCHHCKKPGLSEPLPSIQTKKARARKNMNSADNYKKINGGGQTNVKSHNKISNKNNANNTEKQKDRKPPLVYPPCETCGKTNHSTENCCFGANAQNRPPPRKKRPDEQNQVEQRNAQSNLDGNVQATAQTLN